MTPVEPGLDTAGSAYSVAPWGSRILLVDGGPGVSLVDVSVPEAPVIVSTLDTPGIARHAAIGDSFALVADDDEGLLVLDLQGTAQ